MTPNEIIGTVQIQFMWFDRMMLVLLSALAGVIFGFISTKIQRKEERKIETIKSVSKEFLHQLDVLDSLIKDYWSVTQKEMEPGKEETLSSSIFISFSRINGVLNLLFKIKKKNNSDRKNYFEMEIDKIYEHATRNINVEPRDSSQETVMKSSNGILQLRLKFQEFIYQ